MDHPDTLSLADWLDREGISPAQFSIRVGKSRPTVGRWLSGEAFPRKTALKKIAEITGGEVTANSFMPQAADYSAPSPSETAQ